MAGHRERDHGCVSSGGDNHSSRIDSNSNSCGGSCSGDGAPRFGVFHTTQERSAQHCFFSLGPLGPLLAACLKPPRRRVSRLPARHALWRPSHAASRLVSMGPGTKLPTAKGQRLFASHTCSRR